MSAEKTRASAESARNAAENNRAYYENQREIQEAKREEDWEELKDSVNAGINQITFLRNNVDDLAGDVNIANREVVEAITRANNVVTKAENLIGNMMTSSIKQAILNCFMHVSWSDSQGEIYYNALADILFPSVD